jgi:type II secretory pathway pseudopilin PulG
MANNYSTFPKRNSQGFMLIEMIVYIAVITVMFLAVTQTVISFSKSYRDLVALRLVDRSAMSVFERMTRDVRNANAVNALSSVFVTSPGVLAVNQTQSGNSTTTRFYTDNGVLKVDVAGGYVGPLTMNSTRVTSLTFKQMTGTTTAIKVDMTLQATSGAAVRTKTYHTTIILKGS